MTYRVHLEGFQRIDNSTAPFTLPEGARVIEASFSPGMVYVTWVEEVTE